MGDRSIVVLSEGPHEVGDAEGQVGRGALPALPCLVDRLLGEPKDVCYRPRVFRHEAHVRGYKKKVQAAMRKARNLGAVGVAVVVDRDGRSNRGRLGELQEGRDAMSPALAVPCAVGVAVEAFDAWMIADAGAVERAVPGAGGQAHPDPESMDARAAREYARQRLGKGLREKYAAIAGVVDLLALKRKCKEGFLPFADEVEKHLGHLA